MKTLSIFLALIGLSLVIMGVLYVFAPASVPAVLLHAYDPAMTKPAYKTCVGPLALGVGLLVYSGLQRGKK
jgi:hypothetical protein